MSTRSRTESRPDSKDTVANPENHISGRRGNTGIALSADSRDDHARLGQSRHVANRHAREIRVLDDERPSLERFCRRALRGGILCDLAGNVDLE